MVPLPSLGRLRYSRAIPCYHITVANGRAPKPSRVSDEHPGLRQRCCSLERGHFNWADAAVFPSILRLRNMQRYGIKMDSDSQPASPRRAKGSICLVGWAHPRPQDLVSCSSPWTAPTSPRQLPHRCMSTYRLLSRQHIKSPSRHRKAGRAAVFSFENVKRRCGGSCITDSTSYMRRASRPAIANYSWPSRMAERPSSPHDDLFSIAARAIPLTIREDSTSLLRITRARAMHPASRARRSSGFNSLDGPPIGLHLPPRVGWAAHAVLVRTSCDWPWHDGPGGWHGPGSRSWDSVRVAAWPYLHV